jgi:geranylgeranyl diphosphate synthase, type I
LSTIENILNNYSLDIENALKTALAGTPPFIAGVTGYHLGWLDQNFAPASSERGKALRPTLCLLVFEALTGSYREVLPLAVALELIHNFTLIHDDIEDNDLERRGRPTAWAIWGKPLAINVGDYLYTLASKSLYELDTARFPLEKIFAVVRLVNGACLALTEGQDLDLRFEQHQEVSPEMYVDMVYKKTGALIEASIVSGAILGTSDPQIVQSYREFAYNLGIAFQVRDDILGIWGDAARTGKSVNNDLRRKKKTLPIIYMLNALAGQRQAELKALYAGAEPLTDDQIEFVRESLDLAKAHAFAQNSADGYIEEAFGALRKIKVSNQAQTELETIARFLVSRSR